MDAFSERMKARKLKEAQEQAEQQKQAPKLEAFPVTISMNILAPDWNEAEITLNMLIENLNRFDDLSDVKNMENK